MTRRVGRTAATRRVGRAAAARRSGPAAALTAALLAVAACGAGGDASPTAGGPAATDASRVADGTPERTSTTATSRLSGSIGVTSRSAAPAPAPEQGAVAATAAECPTAYAAPDPRRPQMTLAFAVDRDGRTVHGRQRIQFTPDRSTSEIVLRLWANSPRPVAAGGGTRVTALRWDLGASWKMEWAGAGAGSAGTLLRIRLKSAVAAGTTLRGELSFVLRLPVGANDRWGSRNGTQWWATGFPLLAWERGRGWAQEPATSAFAEATTSEDFRLVDLAVTAPATSQVIATGIRTTVQTLADGRRTTRFTAESVRDAAIAVGRFRTASSAASGVPVYVGVAPGLSDDPARVASVLSSAIVAHRGRFGPFPYPQLATAVVTDISGGIEYPGAILLGTGQLDDPTASHEVAHEWFYGLVGDNQGRDPWLDESFATYAEALHRGTGSYYESRPIPASGVGRVGWPMSYWERYRGDYYRSVYIQGAAALLRARRTVGAAAFDEALRCHINRMARRIATPADLEASFAHLPDVIRILREVGALR